MLASLRDRHYIQDNLKIHNIHNKNQIKSQKINNQEQIGTNTKKSVLEYHNGGKIGITTTKPCDTQEDLSKAYTPGVAIPCLEIQKDESLAYNYTNKGNLVAVITDGTAVLGLGDIGALAGKPVMEGKQFYLKSLQMLMLLIQNQQKMIQIKLLKYARQSLQLLVELTLKI